MRTKTKLKEEVLNEQPQAPVAAPVQADPAEVQAAQAAAPAAEQPLVEEPAPAEEVAQPAEPEAETISIEMQIPTDQLAAAVAQVTGDIEAAETAPDVEEQKQSEVASLEAPEVAEEAPTEASTEEPIIESLSEEEKDVIREYRKYKASKMKETEDPAEGDAAKEVVVEDEEEDMAAGAPNVDEAEPAPIQEALEDEAEVAEEDMDVEIEDDVEEDEIEDEEDGEAEEDVDPSIYEEVNLEDGDLVGQLTDIFDDEDDVEDTADALRTSADFLDSILALDDEIEEEFPEDEIEDEEEEGFKFEDVVGDPEDTFEDEVEEEAEDEELEVEDVLNESKLQELDGKHRARNRYDDAKYTGAAIATLKGNIHPEDLTGEVLDWVDSIVADGATLSDNEKFALEMLRKKYNAQKAGEAFEADPADAKRLGDLYRRNGKKIAKALDESKTEELDESIVYPAGSRPVNSEISNTAYEDNLVKAYESTALARRKALANFRESMKRTSAADANRARFNEAISGSSREIKESTNTKSWRANRFEDRYEERSGLNYKELLKNGFLG